MTEKEVYQMLSGIGYPCAYRQFNVSPGNPAPELPFICFYYPENDDLLADNINYSRINRLFIELYTENKDFGAEAAVEAVLVANDLPFTRTEVYIDSESMWQIVYKTSVVITEEVSVNEQN